jgi:hypothetical protein
MVEPQELDRQVSRGDLSLVDANGVQVAEFLLHIAGADAWGRR